MSNRPRRTKPILAIKDDDEDALRAKAEKKRIDREEKCVIAVNEVLERHKCIIQIYAHVGDQKVPIGSILALPTSVGVASKV